MIKKSILPSAVLVGGLLCGSAAVQAQDRVVKLTTARGVGSEMTLLVNNTYSGVTVDWGDGTVQTYKGAEAIVEVRGAVKGSVITITGGVTWDMLACAGCDLTAIDLSGAKDLRSLYCQNNALTSLDLRGMGSLVDLNCSNNQIEKLTYTTASKPENDLKSIETLDVSDNKLSGSFANGFTTLVVLDVSNNEITSLSVSKNAKLDVLNCSNNALKALTLSSNKQISTVVCNNNEITTLTLPKDISTIRQFICDDNVITSAFDLSACGELSDLSCANNSITSISLPYDTKVNSLNLTNNHLSFASLPRRVKRPVYLSFMPQKPFDVSGFEGMKKKDGVPYMPVVTWDTRGDATLNLSEYMYVGGTSSATGTREVTIEWYKINEDGTRTELKSGTSSTPNDYSISSGITSFFTPAPKVVGRLTSNLTYKGDGFYVETSVFAVGEDQVTAIGEVKTQGSDLVLAPSRGRLTMSCPVPTAVSIYAADGRAVWKGKVETSATVELPSGIYMVNGRKVVL